MGRAAFVAHPPPGDNDGSHCSRLWGSRCGARSLLPRAHSQRRSTVQPARLRPRDTCHRNPPQLRISKRECFCPPRTSHKHGALGPCCPEAPKADAFQVVSRTPRAAEHQPQSIERPHRRPGTPPPGLRTTTPKAPVHRPRAGNDHPEGSGSPPSGLRMTTPKAPVHHPRASNDHPEGSDSPPPGVPPPGGWNLASAGVAAER